MFITHKEGNYLKVDTLDKLPLSPSHVNITVPIHSRLFLYHIPVGEDWLRLLVL